MREPSFSDAFEVLCLQAADEGRGPVLFGDSVERARRVARPFLIGDSFPSVYLEFPLVGEPFLDVTLLYDDLPADARIDSPVAAGCEGLLDWWGATCGGEYEDACIGFELDTSKPVVPEAAVHFQPRLHMELVDQFCAAIGEPERAQVYEDLQRRMPKGWGLSFFGLFRGRPGSPMRVCGYLAADLWSAYGEDPSLVAAVFDHLGFEHYDGPMLEQAAEVFRANPRGVDFQFDVYPDGHLGDTFALDVQFDAEQPNVVRETFEGGWGARFMELLERWGVADGRWRLVPQAAFARSIPVERNGGLGRFSFTLMPGWAKVRWRAGVLQPSKFYFLGKAGILDK